MITSKPVTIAIGLSLCGLSLYLFYKFLKKDEEDDYEDTFIKASKFKVLEVKVPKELVREFIGRNGKNIKNFQEVSGARIYFKNNEEKTDRICVIKGSVDSCHIAEHLIRDFIDDAPVIESEDLWIPRAATGKIIGRSGENITDMQCKSGAKISVLPDESPNLEQVKVKIVGTREQIILAKSLVNEKLQEMKEFNSKLESSLSKREPRMPLKSSSKSGSVDNSKASCSQKNERMSPILGQQDSPFEVYVSALVHPSRFWIQIVGPKATKLDQLVEEMSDYYSKPESKIVHTLESITKGDLVAAIFQYDNKWYRAEVLNVIKDSETNEDRAELYFVDYGDSDMVPVSEIYELRTDFLQLHFQAIECFLANVEPVDGEWCEEAVDMFEEWTHVAQWKKLSAKINGYCVKERKRAGREGSPVPGVDLYDYNNEKDVNIAEELVNCGYAVYKKEPNLRSSRATSVSSIASN
ncbi:hypothetical protein WA026_000151 [Henosepilachna vigintioctopunctata]|uniref:Tudor domain-containing protein n=1 Tax=Henosepilachna vigintioctopunctata TaxID=420089 RepID=A0AAW1V541_9CUCU